MSDDGVHAGEPRQSSAGGAPANTKNGEGNAAQSQNPASSHPGKNNFLKVGWGDKNFYPSQWDAPQRVSAGGSVTFVAGDTIAIEASSLTYPATNQFRWKAVVQPLNEDGTPQTSLATPGWSAPVEYSSGPTGAITPNHFVIQATSHAPKQRWTVSIPSQKHAHGNYLPDRLEIYTPRREY
jgi:hypothetical protein